MQTTEVTRADFRTLVGFNPSGLASCDECGMESAMNGLPPCSAGGLDDSTFAALDCSGSGTALRAKDELDEGVGGTVSGWVPHLGVFHCCARHARGGQVHQRRVRAGAPPSFGRHLTRSAPHTRVRPCPAGRDDRPRRAMVSFTRMLMRTCPPCEGTIAVVSHDRAFRRAIADRGLERPSRGPHACGGCHDESVSASGHEAPGRRQV